MQEQRTGLIAIPASMRSDLTGVWLREKPLF